MASLTGHETDETEQGDNLSDDMEDDHLFSSDDESVNYPSEEAERKAWMVHHPSRNGDARYVVKRLSSKVSPDMHDDAIVDLTCEAMFLTQMSHPNIARLRATVGSPGTASFMLVLDRLTENLHVKISHWKRDVQHCRGKLGFFRRDKVGLEALFTERLLAAFDIARALRHLHRHKIIYRDIKVSFRRTGCVCNTFYRRFSHVLVVAFFNSPKILVSTCKETCVSLILVWPRKSRSVPWWSPPIATI